MLTIPPIKQARYARLAAAKFGGVCDCGDHAWATLSRGYVTFVSAMDADIIKGQAYFARIKPGKSRTVYALRTIEAPTRRSAYLHRDVLNCAGQVDHINGCGLDNRRENLRECTGSQNAANIGMFAHNSSGYKGVSRRRGRWRANIKKNQKAIEIGGFDTAEEAAMAYDEYAAKLFGPFAKLNFPHGWPADHPEE